MTNSRVCSVQFAEPHMVARGLPLCERLGSTAELETQSSRRLPSLWHQLQIWGGAGVLKTTLRFVCLLKRLTELHWKLLFSQWWFITGSKISQRKKCVGQSQGMFQMWSFHNYYLGNCVTLLTVMCDNLHGILSTRVVHPALVFILGLHYMGMIDWVSTLWFQFLVCNPSMWTPKLLP